MSSIKYQGFIDRDYFSRYSKDRVINDQENKYLEYDSFLDYSNLKYIYHTITSRDVNRLTLISMNYYNNPLYWWIIANANSELIMNPLETPPIGTKIKIPYIDDVVRLYNILV